jgi:hypothetical protein
LIDFSEAEAKPNRGSYRVAMDEAVRLATPFTRENINPA